MDQPKLSKADPPSIAIRLSLASLIYPKLAFLTPGLHSQIKTNHSLKIFLSIACAPSTQFPPCLHSLSNTVQQPSHSTYSVLGLSHETEVTWRTWESLMINQLNRKKTKNSIKNEGRKWTTFQGREVKGQQQEKCSMSEGRDLHHAVLRGVWNGVISLERSGTLVKHGVSMQPRSSAPRPVPKRGKITCTVKHLQGSVDSFVISNSKQGRKQLVMHSWRNEQMWTIQIMKYYQGTEKDWHTNVYRIMEEPMLTMNPFI